LPIAARARRRSPDVPGLIVFVCAHWTGHGRAQEDQHMSSDSDPIGTPGVRLQPPPEMLLRMMNPTVRALLGTSAGRLLPSWMAVLIFTGRHSGTRYRVP